MTVMHAGFAALTVERGGNRTGESDLVRKKGRASLDGRRLCGLSSPMLAYSGHTQYSPCDVNLGTLTVTRAAALELMIR